jgi:hypothetical protein
VAAEGIAQFGLGAKYYGTTYQRFADWLPLHVLATNRAQASGWAPEGAGAIVTIRVPDDKARQYLTCLDDSCQWCGGANSGLLRPLPVRMIHAIEFV